MQKKGKTYRLTDEQLEELEEMLSGILENGIMHRRKPDRSVENDASILGMMEKLVKMYQDEISKLQHEKVRAVSEATKSSLVLDEVERLARIGNWEWNLDTQLVTCSDEMLKLFECPSKSRVIPYNELAKKVVPHDNSVAKRIIRRSIQNLQPFNIFIRIIKEDNSIRMLEIRGSVISADGKARKLFGTVQDITHLKEAEEKLFMLNQNLELKVDERTRDLKKANDELVKEIWLKKKAQNREHFLASIVESSNDAMYIVDNSGMIRSWNRGATLLYGYDEEDIVGNHISGLLPVDCKIEFDTLKKKVKKGENVQDHKTFRINRDGNRVDISLTMTPVNNDDTINGYAIIEKDITSLISSQKRFELAVEASPNGMVMIDEKGKIVLLNSQTEEMFGYERDELMGETIDILLPDRFRKSHKTYRNKFSESPESRPMGRGRELFARKKDGAEFNVEIGLNPIITTEGTWVLASIVDVTEKKKYEAEIKKSEEKYSTLVKTMNEGVLAVNQNHEIEFTNEHMCQMLGYSADQLIGMSAFDLLPDDEAKEQMRRIEKLRHQGISSKYEIQLKTKSNDLIWVLVSGSPMYNSEGEIIGSVGFHTNITQRKEMEDQLDAIARLPLENPNPIFRYSIKDDKLLYSNPASTTTIGFLDKNNHLKDDWMNLIEEVYASGKSIKNELEIDDQTFMCTIVPITDKEYVNVYAVDITAIKRAEAEIAKLSLALSKTENCVMIADKEGIIQWVNEGFTKITGYKKNEIIGTRGEPLRKGEMTGLYIENEFFKKMLKTKNSISYESRNFKKNGDEYWTISTLTPVFDDEGNLDSVIALDTDITDKKQAEQEILKAKKIAEESAKSKELFLANMSHEIRTPMNAIMGFIQLLEDTRLNKQQREYLNSMDFASEHLLRIVNDVLDMAKIDSGKVMIESIEFNLHDLFDQIYNTFHFKAVEKGLELHKEISPTVPENIIGDPIRLNQILTNFISNAIKFTDEGEVRFKVELLSKEENNARLKFIVSDTGIGISKEDHDKIFNDFEQADKGSDRVYMGTGLGLAIVNRLVELQNGKIYLESDVGEGATFFVELEFPIASVSTADTEKQITKVNEDSLSGKSVLLVEDNVMNQMVAVKFLEDAGMKVTTADNGLEGIQELKANNYDIILMDLQMPEMDGYAAATVIRNELTGKKSKIPIIAMSAHAISGERQKCLDAGMNSYISKPVKRETLYLELNKFIKP